METPTPIDWAAERDQFPAAKNFVYFASAATAPLKTSVYNACQNFLNRLHYEGDTAWDLIPQVVNSARCGLAGLLNSNPQNFAFGPNTNYNMGLLALAFKQRFGLGQVIVSPHEFPSSYVPWRSVGYDLKFTDGPLEKVINNQTRAVISSSVHSLTGERIDLKRLANLCEEKNIPLLINATQSLGVFPLNLQELPVSAMTCSAYKWLGAGFGSAVLYVRPSLQQSLSWPLAGLNSFDDPSFSGQVTHLKSELAAAIELGTFSYATIVALDASLKEILRVGAKQIENRVLQLSDNLAVKCAERGIEVLSPRQPLSRSHIVLLADDNAKLSEQTLRERKILVNERRGALRLSLHYFNSSQDIDHFLDVYGEIKLRR